MSKTIGKMFGKNLGQTFEIRTFFHAEINQFPISMPRSQTLFPTFSNGRKGSERLQQQKLSRLIGSIAKMKQL